ncbi:MAG: hypothetical protein E6J93_08820 [Methanobacteriota archaeon]|nr:MAG: hypothetical protein E6J93_08820 [Euryarchaeota archaeon]
MDRELWIRGAMVLSIFALATLIVVTPNLIGKPPAELASLPLLIIGMPRNYSYFIVYLSAAVQAYRYEEMRISIGATDPSANGTVRENETYGLHAMVPTQMPSNGSFSVHTYLVDQLKNYFEYNVTVRADLETGRVVMVFTFPDEKDNPSLEVKRYPPGEDFRWVVPPRGTLP